MNQIRSDLEITNFTDSVSKKDVIQFNNTSMSKQKLNDD